MKENNIFKKISLKKCWHRLLVKAGLWRILIQ